MILVTGGTGFVGKALVRRLKQDGEDIRILARNPSRARGDVQVVKGDVTIYSDVRKAVVGCDLVYHLAGLVSYSKSQKELDRVNKLGTENVFKACANEGIKRVVLCSSVSAGDLQISSWRWTWLSWRWTWLFCFRHGKKMGFSIYLVF